MRSCVICHTQFDETKVDHLPGRKEADRWTDTPLCQKRLERRIELRDESVGSLASQEFVDEEVSEAEKARTALGTTPAVSASREAPELTGTSPMEYALASRHLVDAAAALSEPDDRFVVLSLASGFLARSVELLEPETSEASEDPVDETVATVPSATKPGVVYRVSKAPDGALSCTCPGFENRKTCRHVERAKLRR